MRGFFFFSLLYLAVSFVAVEIVRGNGLASGIMALRGAVAFAPVSRYVLAALLAILIGCAFLRGRSGTSRLAGQLGFALMGTVAFLAAFAQIKNLLPAIQPFHADVVLADLDAWLHGGADPWRATHDWARFLPVGLADLFYFKLWSIIGFGFPVLLATLDDDETRVRRFLALYAITWIGIGNLCALVFMSAGPVFYDQLLGTERFVALLSEIRSADFASPLLALIQESLWAFYVENEQVLGTGISAFPSVHVAIACVGMMYVLERLPRMTPLAAGFLAAILYLSVYSGFHYAIDGYFSILFVVAAWAVLLRRDAPREAAAAMVPAE